MGVSVADEPPTRPAEPPAGRDPASAAAIVEQLREFREELPEPTILGMSDLAAYEEHALFVYAAGRLAAASGAQAETRWRHLLLWKPSLLIMVDGRPTGTTLDRSRPHISAGPVTVDCLVVRSAAGPGSRRSADGDATEGEVWIFRVPASEAAPLELEATVGDAASTQWTIQAGAQRVRLTGVVGQPGRGLLDAWSMDGAPVLESRLLPAGILPHGRRGAEMLARWDASYRGEQRAGWDTGRVASDLRDAVRTQLLRPGRAVEFGCGNGTNAVFLAQEGFDVTALDLAPTALAQARQRAEQAGVQVRWLLADVTAPPELEPVDVVFDRGCYHGVRRENAQGYVAALRRVTRPGARILILAGNANEQTGSGPPRVTEQELRDDFSAGFRFIHLETTRFDSATADRQGALAWSVLLERL
ncbi:MAG: class I SAM-dependent methyltransferase [Pirellulaceae bacterium]|nr:class I SAM-dependent methyltransferase [Pirellulaceae bacterium]